MDIAENNLIRFKNISRKKDGIFANYRVKALHNGVLITATIAVDITALDLDPNQDPMEKIIEECAKLGLKELKKAAFEFEGTAESTHLGVAQLG